MDEDASINVLDLAKKQSITEYTYVVNFDCEEYRQGYWTYAHFLFHCEDVIDFIYVAYAYFQLIFSVDHSC